MFIVLSTSRIAMEMNLLGVKEMVKLAGEIKNLEVENSFNKTIK